MGTPRRNSTLGGLRTPHLQSVPGSAERLGIGKGPFSPAACREIDPELFFASEQYAVGLAKQICGGCPVRGLCLTRALDNREQFGIFGGLTADERRNLRRREVRAA
ncbi:WhiB family transcriptional regulator [Streptomyces violascens]|uniref:WhiB family transcriptional regulator n=1 Tax=Streptomyces violascens TaxID=67381 RepID=UPI00369289C9